MTELRPHWLWVLVFLVGLDTAAASQSSQRFAWWRTEAVVAELGLTPDQTSRIDKIFQAMRVEARQELDELERLEGKLSRLIETDADEAMVVRAIDRVETARATLSKTRSLMLLRMRQVLTADQRVKLTALQKRWDEDGRRQGGDRRPGSPTPSHRNQ
jgi:Spy/CpxP family protein refolding chaperone